MNQADLIAAVAAHASLTNAGKAVEALVGTITEALQRGERQGRNPQTGAAITIAASKAARFTAGKAVKDALNGG